MKKNMGSVDKTVRVIAAVLFIAAIATSQVSGTLAWILGILAAVFVATSLVGVCPLYLPFGISTCPVPKKKH